MAKIICPDCGHPVDIHCDFFCMHTECYCNSSQATAEARYWAIYYMDLYNRTLYLLKLERGEDFDEDFSHHKR